MPEMFRPGGVKKFFGDPEQGRRAGFFDSFNDMAQAQREAAGKAPAVVATPVVEQTAPPAPPVEDVVDDRPQPVLDDELKAKPKMALPDMLLGEVKALAEKYGLDTSVHHMTLRKQVEECINAKERSD